MKKALCLFLLIVLSLSAQAEVYPVYEIIHRPALLRSTPELRGFENVLLSVTEGTEVIAEPSGEFRLILTQDGYCGYISENHLKKTGKMETVDFLLGQIPVTQKEDVSIQYITIDPGAILPSITRDYPKTMHRGARTHDEKALLTALLGEEYITKPRSEWSMGTDYAEKQTDKPWETKSASLSDDGALSYYDPQVSGERGGEYQPPSMNMLPSDSVHILKGLLSAIFTNGETDHVGQARLIEERWSYADRWMTDSEYREYMYGHSLHYFTFEHRTPDGLSILDDDLNASVGVNGLNGFELFWHEFTADPVSIAPMSLEQAVQMANSTRMAPATLLYAELVYSNRLTQSDEFNLSWHLVTDKGRYVVDCVLNRHVCDSYEY